MSSSKQAYRDYLLMIHRLNPPRHGDWVRPSHEVALSLLTHTRFRVVGAPIKSSGLARDLGTRDEPTIYIMGATDTGEWDPEDAVCLFVGSIVPEGALTYHEWRQLQKQEKLSCVSQVRKRLVSACAWVRGRRAPQEDGEPSDR